MIRRQEKQMHLLFRQLPLLAVLLAAFVFSAGSGLKPLIVAETTQIQSSLEADEEDNRPVSFVDCASSALVPVAQISFLHQPVFKVQVLTQYFKQDAPRVMPPILAEEFFKTLFRLIISPNAP
jgi:hypothetical protein